MNKRTAAVLSSLFFLEFVIKGTLLSLTSLYCRDYLGFGGIQTGLILTTETIAAFLSPLILIFLADRVIRVERLLMMNELAVFLVLSLIPFFRSFAPVFFLFFIFNIFHKPDFALINALTFRNLSGRGRNDYGKFRVWGTLGWIGAAVFFSCIWMNPAVALPFERNFGGLFHVAGGAAFLSALIIFRGLCHFRQDRSQQGRVKGENFFRSLCSMERGVKLQFLGFMVICIFMTMQDHYYFMGAAPFLKDMGLPEGNIALVISLGMITEVAVMVSMGRFLNRFGVGKVMGAGAFFCMLKYLIFAAAPGPGAIIPGILCHGLVSALFLSCTFIHLDSFSRPENRAAFHQFYSLAISAPASLLGYMLGGAVMDGTGGSYTLYWLIPAVTGGFSFLAIPFFIKTVDEEKRV